MKPFSASEFISNTETPVVCRNKKPVEIVTAKGRGGMPVIGYIGDSQSLHTWSKSGMFFIVNKESELDLFFAPKNEVVHVFELADGSLLAASSLSTVEAWKNTRTNTYLGTITGPIVPSEVKP